jgi:predicted secreted hydrolase
MNPRRRAWLMRASMAGAAAALPARAWSTAVAASAPSAANAEEDRVQRGRRLVFPRDHGMHPAARIEWWYATGWLAVSEARASSGAPAPEPRFGFQLTFFRSRTGVAESSRSRFAARHLLFAHAAVTDLGAGTHLHAQRLTRFAGEGQLLVGDASSADTQISIAGGGANGPWRFWREEGGFGQASWFARLRSGRFALDATLAATQPLLLQGDAGFSRKGPEERQASHYYSAPQLDASVSVQLASTRAPLRGRAWLDHEWSDELMHPSTVGWDWIGINLFDGAALTAFQLRRADGSALWAGGSWRANGEATARGFKPGEVQFKPGRVWSSPTTKGSYPVHWSVDTPAGRHTVRALLDAQELDSRTTFGAVYWEGLAELLDASGRRIGLGYLEMTGYASALRLG